MNDEAKDSFTIGTSGSGGAVKVYFKDITDKEVVEKKINAAVEWHLKAKKAIEALNMR